MPLYKYAIRWSCCASPSCLSIFGMSAARVELRIRRTALVVRFCGRQNRRTVGLSTVVWIIASRCQGGRPLQRLLARLTLASSTPSPYGGSDRIAFSASAVLPLYHQPISDSRNSFRCTWCGLVCVRRTRPNGPQLTERPYSGPLGSFVAHLPIHHLVPAGPGPPDLMAREHPHPARRCRSF